MIGKSFVTGLLLSFFLVLILGNEVLACTCSARPPVYDAFNMSANVFIAQIDSIQYVTESDQSPYQRVGEVKSAQMTVERVFKGDLKSGASVTFGQGGGADCLFMYTKGSVGRRVLYYVDDPGEGYLGRRAPGTDTESMYYATYCGRSKSWDSAHEDRLFLENLKMALSSSRISASLDCGKTCKYMPDDFQIEVAGKERTYRLKPDENMIFELYDAPAGEYTVKLDLPKGIKLYSYVGELSHSGKFLKKNHLRLYLREKGHVSFRASLHFDNNVSGIVFGPEGEPLKGVCVHALKSTRKKGQSTGNRSCSDERGNYSISGLEPGSYQLVTNPLGSVTPDTPFERLFYPGVPTIEEASVVNVEMGRETSEINIQVPSFAPLTEIRGVLLYSDGEPAVGERVRFVLDGKEYPSEGGATARTDKNGRFVLRALKGSKGRVNAEDHIYKSQRKTCSALKRYIDSKGGKGHTSKTNTIVVDATLGADGLRLIFPHPSCPGPNGDSETSRPQT